MCPLDFRWYSNLIGLIEEHLFQSTDVIMVNSHFTGKSGLNLEPPRRGHLHFPARKFLSFSASQFTRVMPRIEKSKIRVVYPPCDVDSIVISVGDHLLGCHFRFFTSGASDGLLQAEKPMSRRDRPQNDVYVFMSMNRFWPEKRLDIIVEAACAC